VHDRHARPQAVHQRGRARLVDSMMRSEVQIDVPIGLFGHITPVLVQVKSPRLMVSKLPYAITTPTEHRVIGISWTSIPGPKAAQAGLGLHPRLARLQHLAVGRNHRDRQAGERDRIARHNHRVFALALISHTSSGIPGTISFGSK